MAYHAATYIITRMNGNVFSLAIMFGFAEFTASIFSGWMMNYFGARITYCFMAFLTSFFSLLLFYAGDFLFSGNEIGAMVVLYISILGVGGVWNCFFCVMEAEMAP